MPYAARVRDECIQMVLTDHTQAGTFRTKPFRLAGAVVQPASCESLDNHLPQPLGGNLPYGRADVRGHTLEATNATSWSSLEQPTRLIPFELVGNMLWDDRPGGFSVIATGEANGSGEFHLTADLPPDSRYSGRCVSVLVVDKESGNSLMRLEFDYP